MNKAQFIEIKNIIKKIKIQDTTFGQYLEENIIFDGKQGKVIYLGKPIEQVPHLPFIIEE